MAEKTERHAGFELLRIVSMTMIVVMHAIGHGGLRSSVESGSVAYHIYWLLYALSRVSTNCFVMLTGYYMVASRIRLSRVFRIWCEVLFYSLLTYGIAIATGSEAFSMQGLIRVCTPISSGEYWFATGYVILYLAIPLLNRVIQSIKSQREFQRILLAMLILTSVLPTVLYWADPLYVNGGYSYVWFIVLYFLAAYIRLYDIKRSTRFHLLVYLGLALTVPVTRLIAEIVQTKIGATTLVDNVMDYKMPVTVVMSIAFFMLFKNLQIQGKVGRKIILTLAPMSFGVYLLHDSDHTRALLWGVMRMTRYSSLALTLLHVALVTLAIVAVCYVVDFLYQRLYRLLPTKRLEGWIDGIITKEWR